MKQCRVLLLLVSAPLFSMDGLELTMPETESARTSRDGRPSLIKQTTPQTLLDQQLDNHLISIDAFVSALHFNEAETPFNQEEIAKLVTNVPVELFNKIVSQHTKLFGIHLNIKENNTDHKLTTDDIRYIRERIFHELLNATQQEKELLKTKYIGRRDSFKQNEKQLKKMERCCKIQCCFLFGLPVAFSWAIATTTLLLLKNNC